MVGAKEGEGDDWRMVGGQEGEGKGVKWGRKGMRRKGWGRREWRRRGLVWWDKE